MEKEPENNSTEFGRIDLQLPVSPEADLPQEKIEEELPKTEGNQVSGETLEDLSARVSNISKISLPPSLISPQEKSVLEPNSRDIEYIKKYRELQLGVDPEQDAFVLTPRMFFEIEALLPEFTNKVAKSLELEGKTRVWEASPIVSILAKSLLEESTKYSTWISERIAQKGNKEEQIRICDLCSGAGITSSKIYKELKNKGFQNIQIHGVDNSVESLSVSYLLFQTQGIPCTLVKGPQGLKSVPLDYDGIVLVYDDAETYLGKAGKSITYHDIVSENGISYFSREKHKKVLEDSRSHLLPNAGIYLASLNPKLTVELSKPFLIKEILSGKNKFKEYESRIKSGKAQYLVSADGEIKKAMTLQTGRQIEFMNYLLKTDIVDFMKYMKGLGKATKAAKILKDEILSPVNEVHSSVKEIYEIGDERILKYPEIKGAPCDVIEVKVL